MALPERRVSSPCLTFEGGVPLAAADDDPAQQRPGLVDQSCRNAKRRDPRAANAAAHAGSARRPLSSHKRFGSAPACLAARRADPVASPPGCRQAGFPGVKGWSPSNLMPATIPPLGFPSLR